MGIYRAQDLRRIEQREHWADMVIGVFIGAPVAVVLWLVTLWLLAG